MDTVHPRVTSASQKDFFRNMPQRPAYRRNKASKTLIFEFPEDGQDTTTFTDIKSVKAVETDFKQVIIEKKSFCFRSTRIHPSSNTSITGSQFLEYIPGGQFQIEGYEVERLVYLSPYEQSQHLVVSEVEIIG